jgi:molecular chaperone DnaK
MARIKIDYGIDLGTTNSAIARVRSGNIIIVKSDTQKDTTPSCVHFTKKQTLIVGDAGYNRYGDEYLTYLKDITHTDGSEGKFNSFIEFKRTMGTDKLYQCSHMDKGYSSEELSSEILKTLKTYIRDDDVQSAIITVPAQFRQNQLDATQRAADLAGFKYCELLQEPIAASLAYGVDTQHTNGYWLVFDFGGGTFDAAIMKVVEGIMKVVDTDGDNHLGGKNLDYAIVDSILIPYLRENYKIDKILSNQFSKAIVRDALKFIAEEAKISLSINHSFDVFTYKPLGPDDEGEDMELDLTITLQDYERVAKPSFQRSLDIVNRLLERNNLTGNDLETVVLVGGPTFSQTLRKILVEQLTSKIDTTIDPMTAVAKGAALFASTRDIPQVLRKQDRTKVQLALKYPETTVELEENVGFRIQRDQTDGTIPARVFAEIGRDDKGWSSGRIEMHDDVEITVVQLDAAKANGFSIALFDEQGNGLPVEPSEFTIIQGLKVANATLPYSLCIDAFDTQIERQVLQPLRGLEKNQTLPARGKNLFKNQKEMRPGKKEDVIKIPIYEGEPFTRAILNELAGMVILTGEDIPSYLPANSDIEITIEIDSSRRIKLSADFRDIDETVEFPLPDIRQREYDIDLLESEITHAMQTLAAMKEEVPSFNQSNVKKLQSDLDELEDLLEKGSPDYNTKTQVMERLREILKSVDKLQEASLWPKVESDLSENLRRLVAADQKYGEEGSNYLVEQLRERAGTVMKEKSAKVARDLIREIKSLEFKLVSQDIGLWISFIRGFDQEFDTHAWRNRTAAHDLIMEANDIIATSPSKTRLRTIVRQLFALLPERDRPILSARDEQVLRK